MPRTYYALAALDTYLCNWARHTKHLHLAKKYIGFDRRGWQTGGYLRGSDEKRINPWAVMEQPG